MNRLYRSIWNAARNTFVAVAENSRAQGKPASSSSPRSPLRPLALEPRLMFDAAAVTAAVEAVHADAPAIADAGHGAALAEAAARLTQAVPAAVERREIVFVENNVPDLASLLAGMPAGREVVVLDSAQDGLAQMAAHLQGRSGIDALHVVSHGAEASLGLGTLTLTSANLSEHASDLATLRGALNADADVLLYGCDVGAGSDGAAFVAALAQATQADVAASSNLTGAADQGGDWVLERAVGRIDATTLNFADYRSILPSVAGTVSSSGQQNFDDYGAVFNDGEGGSADITGIEYDIYFADTSHSATSSVAAYNYSASTLYPLLAESSFSGQADELIVKSSGGENFKLTSFFFLDINNVDATWTVKAYNNGQQVGSDQTFTVVQSGDFTKTVTLSSDFENVDEVRITAAGGVSGGHIWGGFNDFVFADPVTPAPTITSATYNVATGVLSVTGTNMTASDPIDVSKLTLSGEGGLTRTLTSSNVTAGSATAFSVTLNAADRAALTFLNKNGTASTSGTTFNLAAADDWDINVTAGNTADATNGVTVSNVAVPNIVSSTYDAATGVLVVTGTGFLSKSGSANDIAATKLTLRGEGSTGALYRLTSSDVDITSSTSFTITLNAADQIGANLILQKNGTASKSGTSYRVNGDEDWAAGADAAVTVADTSSSMTVSNVSLPTVTSASYDVSTGVLTVTGTHFVHNSGATNDVAVDKLTLHGDGSDVTLTGNTNSVEVTSDTSFSLTLGSTDKAAVDALMTRNGTTSAGSVTYNLAAAEDWMAGTDAALTIVDATNAITVSNVPNAAPVIGGLSGDSVAWAGVGAAVTLDSGGDATASDTETGALNSGNGDWGTGSGSLTVQRVGGAVSSDTFAFDTTGQGFTVSGSNLQSGGLTFATFTSSGGTLTVSFSSSATAATTALVQQVMRSITYRNDTPAGDAAIRFSLSDGTVASTADVTVTSDTIYVTNATDTAAIDRTDGVSFSEAVAIAAADNTGSQTLVVDSSISAVTLTGNVAINESLTIDSAASSGVTLSGSTITLGSGTTLAWQNGSGDVDVLASTVAGSGALTKAGAGKLTLASTSNAGGWSGAMGVTAGTLSVASDSRLSSGTLTLDGGTLDNGITSFTIDNAIVLGSGGGTLNVTNAARTLTLSGVVSGSGALSKVNGGTLVLTGTNTYGGGTSISGTNGLTVNDGSNLGSGTVTVNTLLTVSNAATLSNHIVLNTSTSTVSNANALTLSGVLSGDSLTKLGAGRLTLTGSNTYTGSTTVSDGSLQLGSDANLGAGALTIDNAELRFSANTTLDNAMTLANTATIDLDGNDVTLAGVISGSGTLAQIGGSTLVLSGSNDRTGATHVVTGLLSIAGDANLGSGTAAVSLESGTALVITGAATIAHDIVVADDWATIDNAAAVTVTGVLSGGSLELVKDGAGTLTLTNTANEAGFVGGLRIRDGVVSVATDDALVAGTVSLNGGSLSVSATTPIDNDIALVLDGAITAQSGVTATFSGVVSDSAALTLDGAGTVVLTGTNTYTGTTTVTAGTLSVASDANLGSDALVLAGGNLAITGAAHIDNAITLGAAATVTASADSTLSGVIDGSGALTKAGAGTLSLSGSSSHTGTTTVTAGTLSLASDANLGSGALTLNGGGLAITGTTNIDNAITLAAAATVTAGADAELSGVLGGSGALTKAGSATLTLSGTNTHSGNVEVAAGGLTVRGGSSIADTAAVIVDSGATLTLGLGGETIGSLAGAGNVVLGYRLTTGGDNTSTTFSGVISGSGNGISKAGSGTFTLSGSNTYTGSTSVSGGVLSIAGASNLSSSSSISLNSATLAVTGAAVLVNNFSVNGGTVDNAAAVILQGNIGGSGSLSKSGSGTLTLSGSNSHASTVVSAGTLSVSGSANLGSGSLTLAGGNLALGGTIANALVLAQAATLTSAGSSTVSGAISGSGNLTKAGGGSLTLSGINTSTGSTTLSAGALSIASASNLASGDLILGGGNLVVTGTTTLTQAVALTQNATLVNSADLTLAGVVSGSSSLVKLGAGNLTLSNTNTTTGTLTVLGGALNVAGQAELGDVSLSLNGGSLNVTGAGSLLNTIQIGSDGGTINNSANVSLTGGLSGTGTLTKTGAGTLTLTDTGTEANLTGGLAVMAGTVAVADDDALVGGSISLNGGTLQLTQAATIDNALQLGSGGGTLNTDSVVTLSGAIGGVGGFTKAGSGTLTLSGSNSHGDTTVAAGTLKVASDGNLGSGTVTLAQSTTLQVTGATTIDNGITLSGNASLRIDADVTLSGALAGGARALTKLGSGTLSLSNTANEAGLTGSLTVMAGTVAVATDDALVGGTVTLNSGTLLISGATTIDNNLTLSNSGGTVNTSAAATWSGLLSGSAQLTKQGSGTLTLSNTGNAASHSGMTSVRAGTLAVASDSQLGSGVLNLNGGTLSVTGATTIDNAVSIGVNNGSVNNAAALTLSGVVSGGGGLAKAGAGTLTLSGTNTYTGYTALDAGTLSVTGTLGGTSYLNVNGGATLAGSGSVHGEVFVDDGATLAPGVGGIGRLTLDDGLLLMPVGGVLALQVNGPGAGTGHDQLVVHGTVNLNGGTLSLDLSQLSTTGGDTFVLIDNDGNDPIDNTFDGLAEGATVAAGNGRLLQVSYGGGDGNDFTLRALNIAPVAGAISNQVAAEDSAFAFTVPGNAITDADSGDTLSYTATLSSGSPLPSWLSFNPGTRAFSGTPGAGDVGAITVRVTASDGSASAHSDFTLTTSHVNHAPTTSGLSPQAVSEGSAFGYTVPAFADADSGDTLTYTATLSSGSPLPAWLSFDPATRAFSGTPAMGDVGALTVRVTASDGSASTHSDFALVVNHINHAPTTSGLSAQGASEDSAFTFTVPANAFADVDSGDTLTYSATLASGSALPSWLVFDAGSKTFSGTPANGDVGAISLRVTASDGVASVHSDFTLTVANTNDAPTTAGIANQAATEDSAFTFTVPANTFSDVDVGDSLTYGATLANGSALPTWLSFDASSKTFSGTPANGGVGAISVRVTASDGVASVRSDFTLTVANTNDAPTTAGIANQAATEDSGFSFTVPANSFSDVDMGDSLTYSATLANGSALPTWLSFDASTRTFSGTPANGDVGAVSVRVTASDGQASTHGDFTLTVANTNDAPTTAGIANQAATEDSGFSFTVPANTFSDVDSGDALSFGASLANGSALPAWLSFDATTRTFSGTPANGDVAAVAVRVTATDTRSASVHSDFTLTVANVNDAPTLAAPATIVLTDSAATDAFADATGQLAAADVDSSTLSFGVDGGSATSRVIDGIAYDLTKAGSHGTLWLNSTTGQYRYGADATAVNAEAHAAQDVFALSVSDGSLAAQANLTVAIAGVDDLSQGSVALSGDARVGQALAANSTVSDAEGVASVARQWQLEDSPGHWTDIAGATGASLTLGGETAGHAVRVVAQVTDVNGAVVTLTSAPTSAVAALPVRQPVAEMPAPPPPAPAPVIASTPVAAPPAGDGFVRHTPPEIGSGGPGVLAAPLPRDPVAAPPPVLAPRADTSDAGRSSSTPLTALPDLGSVPLGSGSALVFQLPPATFQHADSSASLVVDVRQADGRPLPSWLRFDPAKGTISGQAPEGFKGVIHIRIVARDAQGHAASTKVDLDVGGDNKADQPLSFGPLLPLKRLASRPGLTEQLQRAGQRHATAERLAAVARTSRG